MTDETTTETEETTEVSDGTYLAIQPATMWSAQVAVKGARTPSPYTPGVTLYNSIQECIDANVDEAEATEFGYRVSSKQILDALSSDPNALISVYRGFMENGIDRDTAFKVVKNIQAQGVVFSMRPSDLGEAENALDGDTEAPEGVSEDTIPPGEDG